MRLPPALLLALLLALPCTAAHADDQPFSNPKNDYYVAPANTLSLSVDEARLLDKVRFGYQRFFEGSLQGFLGILATDASWRVLGPGDSPLFKEYSEENLTDYFETLRSYFKYDYMHINEFVVQGNTVVAFGKEHGRGKPSGLEFFNNWVHVWTFADGKVTRFRSYCDTDTLLLVMQPR